MNENRVRDKFLRELALRSGEGRTLGMLLEMSEKGAVIELEKIPSRT
jgi:hypothetical protein